MKKEKFKKEKFKKETYVSKPNPKVYQRAYSKAGSPEIAQHISSIYENKQKKYDEQKAKILTGEKPTKAKYYAGKTLSVVREGMNKLASQRVISRQVLKKNSMVVNVPDFVAPSILGDENRFFKGEMNKEKRSLFFS